MYFKANEVAKSKNKLVELSNGSVIELSRSEGGGIKAENPVTGDSFCYAQVSCVRRHLSQWEVEGRKAQQDKPEEAMQYKGQQIGYIRVSTAEQSTSRQLADVRLDKVFEEKVSAKTVDRPQLQACLEYVRDGDVLHVHSLDRICRSGAGDAVELVERMTAKGVSVQFHKEGMRFDGAMSAAQKGVLGILAAVAQMERELIKERQAEGIAAAKAAGKHIGRPKAQVTREDVQKLLDRGLPKAKAAKELGIGRATLYRLMNSES
ncbi:recombinase family protein [Vibrio agarivorans]|uniref:recombinase family protein n=1 Tax=Vibrio agarivorans TaxID=153622 RepID=UPI0025B39BE1|nr:recombinase family protein [Vibrio agarivorans]MDN3662650.1 recombinase family protein [Vibrio agarivorans]